MENSGFNPNNLDASYEYFLSLNFKHPESSVECQKLRREADEFFNQDREHLNSYIKEIKGKNPESLSERQTFAMLYINLTRFTRFIQFQ